jgi:hypothetical protein
LTIWKKAISAATSAALLASLLATAVAPAALGAGTVVSSGSTVVGNVSANAFTITLSENTAGTGLGGQITVTLPANVTYSGTVSVTSGSASVDIYGKTVVGGVLTFETDAGNTIFLDTIVISSKIAVGAAATPGAIVATVAGIGASGYLASVTSRSGTLVNASSLPGTGIFLNVPSGCAFVNGAATVGGAAWTIANAGALSNSLQHGRPLRRRHGCRPDRRRGLRPGDLHGRDGDQGPRVLGHFPAEHVGRRQ